MKRLGCLGWLLLGFFLAASVVVPISLWFHSSADLNRVAAAAKAAGIGTTSTELGWTEPTAEQTAVMHRLRALATTKSFGSDPQRNERMPRLGESPTPEFIAFHQQIPESYWSEFEAAIAGLGEREWTIYPEIELSTGMPEIGEIRGLVRLLGDRILLAAPEQIPSLARQGLRLCHPYQKQSLVHALVEFSTTNALCSSLISRLPNLRGTKEGDEIANMLQARRDRLWHERDLPWRTELYFELRIAQQIHSRTLRGFPPSASSSLTPLGYLKDLPQMFLLRLQREQGLGFVIELSRAAHDAKDPADLRARIAKIRELNGFAFDLADRMNIRDWRMFTPSHHLVVSAQIKNLQIMDVLLAELRINAPTVDLFSPTSAKVLPIRRNGKRIGWYSVGPDGVDHGGKAANDFAIPISEKLGRARFSDALEPRSQPAQPIPKSRVPPTLPDPVAP